MARAVSLAALALALAVGTSASAAAPQTLRLSDLRKLVGVGNPQISPDATRVAVEINRRDYDTDRTVTDLVVIDVRTRAQRKLLRATHVSEFAWSPDGTALAYIATPKSEDDPSPQLFVLPMNGGEPLQLTHEKNGVGDFDWRPDGARLAYTATPESRNAKAIAHHEDAFEVTEEAWTEQSPTAIDRLYEISAAGGSARALGDGTWSVRGGFTYARDGKSIFVTRDRPGTQPNQYLATELVCVDVRTGRLRSLPALSSTQSDAFRSRDGSHIAFGFTNPNGSMQEEIGVADASGAQPQWTSQSLDRDVSGAAFMPDDSLLVVANDGTSRRIFHLSGGRHTIVPIGDLQAAGAPSVARDGTIAFTASSANRPNDVYVLRPHEGVPRRLTDENAWLARYAMPVNRSITWRTADGLTADGVLIYPPNWHAGTRAPLVLVIHGGPTTQSTASFSGFTYVLASRGWFVFEPNYRGSDGLGLQFARTTVPHITSVPGDDIERGVDTVLKLGVVDPTRVAVSGWSEGGLMTSWLITHDTRWKAAVSGAAVNDWLDYTAMTDAKDFGPQFIGAKPWANPALLQLYKDESPLTYADRVKTPTLILSDAGDFRVPTPLAYEFYHAVRATGTTVKFVVWPVNGHFPGDPLRQEDVYRQWEAWLAAYLK